MSSLKLLFSPISITLPSASSECRTAVEWETLRDDVIDLAAAVYQKVVTREEALTVVVREFLNDEESRYTFILFLFGDVR